MTIEQHLSREFLRVVEEAAIAASRTMGQGERRYSDHVAVEAMRKAMDTLPMRGTIVIGEGERDEAPMLFIGEKVGRQSPTIPRSTSPSTRSRAPTCAPPASRTRSPCSRPPTRAACCTRPTATWRRSSSGRRPRARCTSTRRRRRTSRSIAKRLDRQVKDLVVIVLDRPRHEQLIEDIRSAGARIRLISDGDLSAGISRRRARHQRARGHGHRRRAGRRARGRRACAA